MARTTRLVPLAAPSRTVSERSAYNPRHADRLRVSDYHVGLFGLLGLVLRLPPDFGHRRVGHYNGIGEIGK